MGLFQKILPGWPGRWPLISSRTCPPNRGCCVPCVWRPWWWAALKPNPWGSLWGLSSWDLVHLHSVGRGWQDWRPQWGYSLFTPQLWKGFGDPKSRKWTCCISSSALHPSPLPSGQRPGMEGTRWAGPLPSRNMPNYFFRTLLRLSLCFEAVPDLSLEWPTCPGDQDFPFFRTESPVSQKATPSPRQAGMVGGPPLLPSPVWGCKSVIGHITLCTHWVFFGSLWALWREGYCLRQLYLPSCLVLVGAP